MRKSNRERTESAAAHAAPADAEELPPPTTEGEDTTDTTDVAIAEKKEVNLFSSSDGKYRNKQRCLVLCLRGATARYRHLLEDLRTMLPHHKKESKLDAGKNGAASAVNDIAQMRGCNTVLFLECRKRQDAYLWLGRVGDNLGPSAKFHLTNCHTMDELRLTGNCMRGSRPILTFDAAFDTTSHLRLLKTIFTDVFGTPRGHPKSKPFVDRVMAFYYADNKVRLCFYFILNKIDRTKEQITMRGCARSFFKSVIILMMSVYQT
jgi:ribosome biogenesis protein BRX1